jgi:LytS/YehU family sensor histidine kinase
MDCGKHAFQQWAVVLLLGGNMVAWICTITNGVHRSSIRREMAALYVITDGCIVRLDPRIIATIACMRAAVHELIVATFIWIAATAQSCKYA